MSMTIFDTASTSEQAEESPTADIPFVQVWFGVALALGLSVEVLFDGHPLGISFPIWAALCVIALLAMARLVRIAPSWPEYTLVLPILFFATMSFIRMEPLSRFLNVALTMCLLAVWVRSFRAGRLLDYGWVDLGVAMVWAPLAAWIRPWPVLQTAWKGMVGDRGSKSWLAAIVRGLVIAIPILVVFIALLGSADIVFADYVDSALRWFDLERLARWLRQTLVVLLSAVFFLGALLLALREPRVRRLIGLEKPVLAPFLGFIEAVVVLGAVDLLFTTFVVIQFAYLFGGQENITATGYTYAEYARRGFGELMAVAFLSLGLIMALGSWTQREDKVRKRWFNGLCSALVGLVGVILVSALKRLLLYENAYGFTRLRTYTHVAIIWMGVLFLVFLGLLLIGRLRRFALVASLGMLGFAATLNLLNIDAFIVRMNANRLEATDQIDIQYLASLSEDAVPGMVELVEGTTQAVRTELLPQLACRRAMLLESDSRYAGWQSYHRSRTTAKGLLNEIESDLRKYTVERHDWQWIVTGPAGEQVCVQSGD
jgi:hypothetical protein